MKKYIYAFIATICLPLSTQAQVEIETAFPDENFRAIIATFDTDEDGSLSEAEIKKITSLPSATMKNKNIGTLDGIENLTYLKTLYCENNKITSLDLSQNNELTSVNVTGNKSLTSITLPTDKTKLTRLHIESNALSAIDVTGYNKLANFWCQSNKITSLKVTSPVAKEIYANNNLLTEVDVTACTALEELRLYRNLDLEGVDLSKNENLTILGIFECALKSLDVTNNTKLYELKCSDNQLEEIDLSKNTVLEIVNLHENKLTEVDFSNNPLLRTLTFYDNQISKVKVSHLTDLTYLRCGKNLLKELDVSTLTKLYMLTCEENQLTQLDVTNCPDLKYFECDKNQLTTLDLSNNTKLSFEDSPGHGKFYKISPQTAVIDAVVVGNNREKVALPLVLSSSESVVEASQFSNLKLETSNLDASLVETNLVVADDPKADVDLYGKRVSYNYLVPCEAEGATDELLTMKVTITTYPYVMYVNPASVDWKDGFYSGTLIVDYDAVVPQGAEAYIATGIINTETIYKDGEQYTSDQLYMECVGEAGDVIPANTPIYVKAATETGLFAFGRNLEEKEPKEIPEGNLLQGTLEDLPVEYQSVLTLGREQGLGTGCVGFWRYRGDMVAAHRAYIDASVITGATAEDGEVKGLVLNFNSDATGIKQIESSKESNAWYNLQGVQMAAPTQKGIYIRNGKKLVVR